MPASEHRSEYSYVRAEDARAFAAALFETAGVPPQDAAIAAACLARADLRGVDTHGVQLIPLYLKRLRTGLVNPRPDLVIDKKTPVAGALDGQNALGFVVSTRAMEGAMEMACDFGVGLVAARRSTHFGMAASYVLQAVEAGYIALVFTNASPAMPPWGGREAMLGTSPFAAAAPSGTEVPYVLDMSPAVAARGKVRRAMRRGERVPEGFGLDAEGRSTTDPEAILNGGVVLPIGGPKGSAISMLMDILGGVFTGAAYAGGVANQFEDFGRPQDVGHFFLAIKPDLFLSAAEFRARMDELVSRVHGVPLAEGFDRIWMPGEIEGQLEAERLRTGIPYGQVELANLEREARESGVAPLPVLDKPFG